MIAEVMREVNNHFVSDSESGEFTIADGKLAVKNKYVTGQYIALTGSVLNDGVYLVKDYSDGVVTLTEATDEAWSGTAYALRVPRDFVALVKRIEDFAATQAGQASNITSASFGVQSYSFATDANGVRAGWQTVFRSELNKFRRMFPDIAI